VLSDFVGISDAYLETIIHVNGTDRIIERQPTDASNPVPFYLCFGHHYNIRLTCDKGTYTWENIIPLMNYEISIIVTSDLFTQTYPYTNVTATATRMNASWVEASYDDDEQETISVTLRLVYFADDSNNTLTTENTTTVAAQQTFTVDWLDLNETRNYYLNITATRSNDTLNYFLSAPAPQTAARNEWAAMLDMLGVWPVPTQYIVGAVIILVCMAVFSTATIAGGCIMTTLVAGFLNLIGWMNTSWNLITLAGALSILFIFVDWKKKEKFGQ
jgi:hypothetical protein